LSEGDRFADKLKQALMVVEFSQVGQMQET